MHRIFVTLKIFVVLLSVCKASYQEALIVANAPDLNGGLVRRYAVNRYVVALDGAADKLKEIGVTPNAILGDFDSVENLEYWGIQKTFDELTDEVSPYKGNNGVLIVPRKNQNYTDLSKGIMFCDEMGPGAIYVVNALGGRLDHTLGNIRILRRYYNPNRKIWLVDGTQLTEFVKDGETTITGQVGDQCAVMAAPGALVTSIGLEYEMNDYKLEFGLSESNSNRLRNESAGIKVVGEALVIHPPTSGENQ